MKIVHDKSVDAAYIYLVDNIGVGGVAKTYCCDPLEVNGQINLDFDLEDRLIGIEVLGASKSLPKQLERPIPTHDKTLPKDICFEDSYVLSITVAPYKLQMHLDFSLHENHPEYRNPKINEHGYFRKGNIVIDTVQDILWECNHNAPPAIDANGEIDWGHLDEFICEDNSWILSGDWGRIKITGGKLSLSLEP